MRPEPSLRRTSKGSELATGRREPSNTFTIKEALRRGIASTTYSQRDPAPTFCDWQLHERAEELFPEAV